MKLFDRCGEERSILTTNEPAKLMIDFSKLIYHKDYYLWIGIYREDGVYCQGIIQPFSKENSYTVSFSKLPLLPEDIRFLSGFGIINSADL